jgi:hypothetical protein
MSDSAPLPPSDSSQRPISRAVIIAVLAASLMVGAFAISTQSYWIDEATSLIVAMAASPADAWKYAQAVGGSAIGAPLYHVYLYVWHKVFGSGEWAMRASNLPWFLLAQLAFLVLLRDRPRLALAATLLAAVSPAVWMYLDETRPYLMQYAAGCWLVAAVARLAAGIPDSPASPAQPPRGILLAAVVLAAVVLFGCHLVGAIWAAGLSSALLWLYATRPDWAPTAGIPSPTPRFRGLIALASIAVFALVLYYIWSWSSPGGGHHGAFGSLLGLPFVAYEFLGLSGYGPGKLQLRTSVAGSLIRSLPALLPLCVIIAALVLFLLLQPGVRSLRRRTVVAWFLAVALPVLVIASGLLLTSQRPLPRHFLPALPAVILALAALIDSALAQKNLIWRVVAMLLPALWLGSSLNLRLREVHAKDDYRTASAIAAAALRDNKEVWWAADAAAAYIYLTPVAMQEVPGRAWAMQAPAWDDIRFKFPPRVIVVSKPDIYDPQSAVARYAAENRFVPALQLHAFTIFTREGEDLPTITP